MSKLTSVAEAQRRAKKRLPKQVWGSVTAGTQRGLTREQNVAAYDEIGFRGRLVVDAPPTRQLNTTVLGQDISFPVIISPAAAQAVAPGGEVPAARAAARSDTAIGQSNFSSMPFEEVAAANPKAFFQLYWVGNRDVIAERVERMRKAGAKALIFTLDAHPSGYAQDWRSYPLPGRINLAAMIKYAPMALSHPGWTLGFLLHGGLPKLTVPNMATPADTLPPMRGVVMDWFTTPIPTWDDVAWVRELWGGPFMVKGVLGPDDARRAVDVGATAISVSNHGGNAMDGVAATIRVLPAVADAVGDQIEVLLDGGIRRGHDVAKALALGAKAVLVGRPYFWGLAAGGEEGVYEVLEVLRAGLNDALLRLGHTSIHELSPDDLIIPDGFIVQPPSKGG